MTISYFHMPALSDGVEAMDRWMKSLPHGQQAKTLEKLGVKIQVLDEKQMAKLGMGALLGVAQGSAQKPRLVVMRWDGAPKAKNKAPIAFVGKGVTFDTGGISSNPRAGWKI